MTDASTERREIALWPTIIAAYRDTWRELPDLARITWAWIAVLTILTGAANYLLWPLRNEHAVLDPPGLVTLILSIIAGASMAVAWHRLLLIGERPASGIYLRVDGTVRRYAGLILAYFLPPILIVDASYGAAAAGKGFLEPAFVWSLIVAIAWVVFAARAALVLPMIAMELPASGLLVRAWRAASTSRERIAMGLLATVSATIPINFALRLILPESPSRLQFALDAIVRELNGATLGMVTVTFLSLSYRQLFAQPD